MNRTANGAIPTGKSCFEQDMAAAEMVPFAGGIAAVFCGCCPGKETVCEDSAALIPFGRHSGVVVVADGLGGQPAGDRASSLAVRRIEESVATSAETGWELRDAILNGFEAANQSVSQLLAGAATTLAVVEIRGRTVRPYHVGDSMILVVGQRGKIKLQTVSHSPVGYAVEAGFLDQDEAMHHEERHLISNMIGAADMHITIGSTISLADRDTLLVASDGLSDNLRVHEIIECIRRGPLERVSRQLRDETLQRMTAPMAGHPSKPDDLSFVLFRLVPPLV